jgi:hypothetical protein
MLVALLALFVALGGPAQAKRLINGSDIKKGTIRTKQIKDHTIALKDINRSAVRSLRLTPYGSIGENQVAANAVTSAKLGGAAVTAGKIAASAVTAVAIADGAVNGAKVADGSLTTADIARFSGRFRITATDLGTILRHTCWTGEPQGLAPELAGADISQDALLVTPLGRTMDDRLALTVRTSGTPQVGRFVLALCNPTDTDVVAPQNGIAFSYVVFDVP